MTTAAATDTKSSIYDKDNNKDKDKNKPNEAPVETDNKKRY